MEVVNKIKKNADAYNNLLGIEYYFCLGYKGKGFEVRVHFDDSCNIRTGFLNYPDT